MELKQDVCGREGGKEDERTLVHNSSVLLTLLTFPQYLDLENKLGDANFTDTYRFTLTLSVAIGFPD